MEEALMAIAAGASAIGLVGPMPSGPGIIPNELIAEINSKLGQKVDTFLLTSETNTERIYQHHQLVNTSTIQIVDQVQQGNLHELKAALPGIKLVQVIHVIDESSLEQAQKAAESADMILLDSGNPNLKIKELGGTGRTHNWAISRSIVEAVPVPVFLAGGLNPDNAGSAIEQVQPYGLDICSGLRSNGSLDETKLKRFAEAVRSTV